MSIYEYHCEDCQVEFQELLLTRAEQANVKCKACGSGNITKLMSGSAVVMGPSGSGPANCEYRTSGGGCAHGGGCGCH